MNDIRVVQIRDDSSVGWAIHRISRDERLARNARGCWFWTTNVNLRLIERTPEQADFVLECAQVQGISEVSSC